jgi:hypothetical protein
MIPVLASNASIALSKDDFTLIVLGSVKPKETAVLTYLFSIPIVCNKDLISPFCPFRAKGSSTPVLPYVAFSNDEIQNPTASAYVSFRTPLVYAALIFSRSSTLMLSSLLDIVSSAKINSYKQKRPPYDGLFIYLEFLERSDSNLNCFVKRCKNHLRSLIGKLYDSNSENPPWYFKRNISSYTDSLYSGVRPKKLCPYWDCNLLRSSAFITDHVIMKFIIWRGFL